LLRELPRLYPDAHCELTFSNAWELLVATILSAQCTDKRVNMVTPALFARLPRPQDYSTVEQAEIEELIRSTGFYRNKAKNLRACAAQIVEQHGGEVPADLAALADLPGVGRKTANVVLGNAFDINAGMVVDTHIGRLARRFDLTRHTDPVKVEKDLMRHFPRDSWKDLSHWLISHGRAVCKAPRPLCHECPLTAGCPEFSRPSKVPGRPSGRSSGNPVG
jgi:endonuclease-3